MTNTIIRPASEKDIPVLLGLLYDLGRPKPKEDVDVDVFRNLVKKYFTDSDKKILVAELDDIEIVGMVSMMFLPRLNRTTLEMYIPELIVLEKHQNQGIGKKLIHTCIELAKEKKCHRIRLESGNQRKESHQFYKNLGFEQSALSFTKNLEF
ncbi:MAG: GNAT family N-acetyltransferase [Nitrosopumilus sp.]